MERMPGPTILIVDDEPDILASIADVLELELGARTLRACDAGEALQILDREDVDLILSDYRMPRMLGDELLRLCAERAPHAARVLLTGHADVGVALRAVNRAHVAKMLLKPVEVEALLREVGQALDEAALRRHRERAFERASRAAKRAEPRGRGEGANP